MKAQRGNDVVRGGLLFCVFLQLMTLSAVAQTMPLRNDGFVSERVGDGSFEPNNQPALVVTGNGRIIRLSGGAGYFSLVRSDTSGREDRRIQLPDDIRQVDSIEGAQTGKTVLIGRVNGSVSRVVIFDNDMQIVDQFLGYKPQLSPDGSFIAFIKFYPPHFVAGTSDVAVLYDVTRSSLANRAGRTVSTDVKVGSVVYPTDLTIDARNTGLEDEDVRHITSSFFWSADSTKYVFSATQDVGPSLQIVRLVLVSMDPLRVAGANPILCRPGETCYDHLAEVHFEASGLTIKMQAPGKGIQAPAYVSYNQMEQL